MKWFKNRKLSNNKNLKMPSVHSQRASPSAHDWEMTNEENGADWTSVCQNASASLPFRENEKWTSHLAHFQVLWITQLTSTSNFVPISC